MENITSLFSQHGLLALFFGVLVEQLGAPIPALPFLLLAGVASADNGVFAVQALAVATLASMIADSVWFYAGRRFGHRVLALLCRISISPDTCVRQSELSFARRGIATLVVAKFVPGLSILTPPLAGAMGMRVSSFVLFNIAGTLLWAGSGIAGGLLFHNQVGQLLAYLSQLGDTAMLLVACGVALYIVIRIWRRLRVKRSVASLPRVAPAQLADLLERGEELVIVDVRVSLAADAQRTHIQGARHIELSGIETAPVDTWPASAKIITYCSCPNDASALKAAYLLGQRGIAASVLHGGIDAWIDAGYPVETIGHA